MPKIGFAPFLLTAVIVSACSGAPDQRIAVPKAGVGATQNIAYRSVALREVSLPSYAASEEIYVADETGLLNSTEGLLWADDPSRAVTLELTRYLSQITRARVASEPWPFAGYPEAEVELRIEDMLAHADGTFRLSGQYFVSSETGRDRARLFDLTVPIEGDATAADIAAARGQAVRDLAVAIARDGLR